MFDQDPRPMFDKDTQEWPARSRWLRMRFAADDMRRRLDGEDEPQEGDSEEACEALREKADDFGDCFGPF
ncbi:hypothetical protein N9917_00045 [Deltaproteobacteria bacterium]|nr:hypothetical protein [Deltaproteobacteria bacterium]